MLKPIELSITILYFACCIGIALYFTRRAGKSSAAYWGAERGIGVFVNGVAVFTTLVSAGSFLGFLGFAAQFGWSFTAISLATGTTLGFVFMGLLIGGPLRRYSELKGKFTLSNFFTERYGPAPGTLASFLILILFSIYIIPQLKAGGIAAEYVLGLSPTAAIVVVGVVLIFYVLLGGMLSVTWTDFVQGLLKLSVMVGLSCAAALHFGGWTPLIERATLEQPAFLGLDERISPWTYVGFPFSITVFILSSPHTIMRLFTAKDVKKGRAALSLTAALCLVFHTVGYLGVSAAALILAPDLLKKEGYDKTFLVAMDALFHPILRGVAVSAILAAIMSTTAGILLTVGAEFSVNIYSKFLHKDASDRQSIRASQVLMLLIGVGTVIGALTVKESIGKLITTLAMLMGSAIAVPLLLGIWWKRANATGGLLGLLGGIAAFLAVWLWCGLPRFSEALVAFPASLVCTVLGSLLTAPPPPEKAAFVEALHTSSE